MTLFLMVVGMFAVILSYSSLKSRTNRLERLVECLNGQMAELLEERRRGQNSPVPAEPEAEPTGILLEAEAPAEHLPALSMAVNFPVWRPDAATPPPPSISGPDTGPDAPTAPLSASFDERLAHPEPAQRVDDVPPAPPPPRPSPKRKELPEIPAWADSMRRWLFSGNLVAKAGLLILFIGVAFLLKYAAERVTIPIELRLAAVVLADIALLVWGWKIRERRRGIGLPVQGAALGILMLVTFAAFRLYDLLPGGMAFGLLFLLTAFTCLLAVAQNAIWLAVFGICGGFASPILTSTGSGSHIGLFSYYGLLSAGILAIAQYRSWRALNLLGFSFTFLIGTAWGVLKYSPEHYLSTQLFLILFVLFYTAIAVAYARRQAASGIDYVDAILVFGVPFAALLLQYALVHTMPFGLAFAALGAGLFYTALALLLWQRGGAHVRLLIQAFVALGIVLGTLAINFALDERWTSAAWAVEGAALVWFGMRQQKRGVALFGVLVQIGAWVQFSMSWRALAGNGGLDATLWMSFLLLAGTAYFMATTIRNQATQEPPLIPAGAAALFLAVAAVWMLGGLWQEIYARTDGATQANLAALSAMLLAGVLLVICARMQWPFARRLSLAVQGTGGVVLAVLMARSWGVSAESTNLFDTPLAGALLIFGGALYSSWTSFRHGEQDISEGLARPLLIWSAVWWYGPVLATLCAWIRELYWPNTYDDLYQDTWALMAFGVALSAPLFTELARRASWPALRWYGLASWVLHAVSALAMLLVLYSFGDMWSARLWLAYGALWLAGEYLLQRWPVCGWKITPRARILLHTLRTAAPWLMIWPAGAGQIQQYMGWSDSMLNGGKASWARYIPAWAMMLVVLWLCKRVRTSAWPTGGAIEWYRQVMIPLGAVWSLLLTFLWNLTQDGGMAPLPYIPVLNPLDLTTGFALLLCAASYALVKEHNPRAASADWQRTLRTAAAAALFAWFNLMLLRSVAHYLGLPYRGQDLFASQFVQTMLSLVWSVSALVLMRRACTRLSRPMWVTGAALLLVVVAKLFLIDLANSGSVARIVSFVGVGVLMVGIGYLAPFPATGDPTTADTSPDPDEAAVPAT